MRKWVRSSAIIAIWVLLFVFALQNGSSLRREHEHFAKGADFEIFYTGASIVAAGHGAHLYELAEQEKTRDVAYPHQAQQPGIIPYNHPAYELLIFLPLAFVSATAAYYVWLSVNACLLLLTSFLLGSWADIYVPNLLVLAASYPIALALAQGQDSILLLLIYVVTYTLLRSGRERLAGVVLAMGLFKFHLILPFVIAFVIARRMWPMLKAFSLTAAFLVLLSVGFTGLRSAISYPAFLLSVQHQQPWMFGTAYMTNLRGLAATYLPAPFVLLASAVVSLLVLAFTYQLNERGRNTPELLPLSFSAALVCTVLVGVHTFPHDASILLLPMLICAAEMGGRNRMALSVVLAAGVIFIAPLSYRFIQPWGVLCLLVLMMGFGISAAMRDELQPERLHKT